MSNRTAADDIDLFVVVVFFFFFFFFVCFFFSEKIRLGILCELLTIHMNVKPYFL